jgi:hypothetical protein
MVAAPGRAPAVSRETTTISSAEIIVIGTTGNSPSTRTPLAATVTTSVPPSVRIGTICPGGGAGTTFWITAMTRIAAPEPDVLVQQVEHDHDQSRA